MFVSRMAGSCGLKTWCVNSEIVHATSNDPEGPYTYNSTVLPYFAHGPSVRRLQDGSYLLMHLGCGQPNMPVIDSCSDGTTPAAAMPHTCGDLEQTSNCNQFNVSVRTAPSLWGPWSEGSQIMLDGGEDQGWWVANGRGLSNPSPYILANGSVLLAFRADKGSTSSSPKDERVSVAMAPSIYGPFVDSREAPAVDTHTGEDPFIWQDERGHWHMLMHNMFGGGVGSHAFSRDAMMWTRSDVEPYTSVVAFTDGTTKNMKRRERPQLVLSPDGQPRYFSSGVMDQSDHAYTLVMKVGASLDAAALV